MYGLAWETIARTLEPWSVVPLGGSGQDVTAGVVPEIWHPIVSSPDPVTRIARALARWNEDFVAMVPKFAAYLRANLVDVRVCVVGGDPTLVYVVRRPDGEYTSWLGWDPRSFGEPPPFWDRFPCAVQTFLTSVHAGFAGPEGDAYGLSRPRWMTTLAARAGEPDGLEDWDCDAEIASTRLLVVTTNGTTLLYCVSPDLPVGQIAMVYEGDIDPQDFGSRLDQLMVGRLD